MLMTYYFRLLPCLVLLFLKLPRTLLMNLLGLIPRHRLLLPLLRILYQRLTVIASLWISQTMPLTHLSRAFDAQCRALDLRCISMNAYLALPLRLRHLHKFLPESVPSASRKPTPKKWTDRHLNLPNARFASSHAPSLCSLSQMCDFIPFLREWMTSVLPHLVAAPPIQRGRPSLRSYVPTRNCPRRSALLSRAKRPQQNARSSSRTNRLPLNPPLDRHAKPPFRFQMSGLPSQSKLLLLVPPISSSHLSRSPSLLMVHVR